MSVDTVIFSRLSGWSGLIPLVNDRLYPEVAPQTVTVPYVVWQMITERRDHGQGLGPSADSGVVEAGYQFDAFCRSIPERESVATALRQALQRWYEPDGDPAILDVLVGNQGRQYEPETRLFRATYDVIIWHRE